jgi:hypothetical protein
MNKFKTESGCVMIKSVLTCFSFWLVISLVFTNQVYGYATIISVTVYAPSQVRVGEEVPVHAEICTGNNRVEYVHDVNALLVLPPNVNLTSGSNPFFIGEMGPGPAVVWIRDWTMIFEQPGTYILVINASCIDTQHIPCWMTNSTTVEVYDYPHVEFDYTPPTGVYINQTVTFNATKSHAQGPGREIISYQWNFGDGANVTSNGPIAEHAYKTTGNFQVSLEITDNRELSSITAANITVNLFGDLNGDGAVNIQDIYIVAHSYGTSPENEKWNSKADINHDEIIDIRDLYLVAREFGNKA